MCNMSHLTEFTWDLSICCFDLEEEEHRQKTKEEEEEKN